MATKNTKRHNKLGLLSFCTFLCFSWLLLCSSASAAIDPETQKPYQLTVVLHVAQHPLLTNIFRETLKRELGDSLQNALGAGFCQVGVVEQHPLISEVEKHGLQNALEAFKGEGTGKVQLVLVNYTDGQYEIQSSQHDGLTGLATSVVRKTRLDDPAGRPLVARTAARMIERDFGLVGTVVGDTRNPQRIQVALKGGKVDPALERWLKKDDVFALAQMDRVGGGQRVRDAVLQVLEEPNKDGVCICRLVARHYDSDPASRLADRSGVLGYRCLKLGTGEGPLRLRLVNERGLPHFNLQIKSSRAGLDAGTDKLDFVGSTNRQGLVQSENKFAHVAFVVVQNGQATVARMPIPIFDDHVAVRTLVLDPKVTQLDELLALRDRCLRRLDDSRQLQAELFKRLVALLAKKDHKGALEEAQAGRERLEADLREFETERASLAVEVGKAELPQPTKDNLLADGGRRQQLETTLRELADFVEARNKSIAREEKVRERDALVDSARILRSPQRAEYAKALALYAEALAKYGRTPELEKEYQLLETAWALKNKDAHFDARKYIYDIWPELKTPEQIRDNLPLARKHFEECQNVGDKLTPRKLILGIVAHSQLLQNQAAGLRRDRQDDRNKMETLKSVSEGLRKLFDDVNVYLTGKQTP
jgi:hypothetical protein